MITCLHKKGKLHFMIVYFILVFSVGFVAGVLVMGFVSTVRAWNTEREAALKGVLKRVWMWYSDQCRGVFPEREVKEGLRM
jgi:hypothetical protein